jgi:hypothetical protein
MISTKEPEVFLNQMLNITPNPAFEEITLGTQTPVQGKWNLLDISGRSIKSGVWKGTSMKINVENLIPGLYFFKIQTATGQFFVCKVLVQSR